MNDISSSGFRIPRQSDAPCRWVPSDEVVYVRGRLVTGGLFYAGYPVGEPIPSAITSSMAEDLISTEGVGFEKLTVAERDAYVEWLSNRDQGFTNHAFVELYLLGLHYRLLVDLIPLARTEKGAQARLEAIEIQRCLANWLKRAPASISPLTKTLIADCIDSFYLLTAVDGPEPDFADDPALQSHTLPYETSMLFEARHAADIETFGAPQHRTVRDLVVRMYPDAGLDADAVAHAYLNSPKTMERYRRDKAWGDLYIKLDYKPEEEEPPHATDSVFGLGPLVETVPSSPALRRFIKLPFRNFNSWMLVDEVAQVVELTKQVKWSNDLSIARTYLVNLVSRGAYIHSGLVQATTMIASAIPELSIQSNRAGVSRKQSRRDEIYCAPDVLSYRELSAAQQGLYIRFVCGESALQDGEIPDWMVTLWLSGIEYRAIHCYANARENDRTVLRNLANEASRLVSVIHGVRANSRVSSVAKEYCDRVVALVSRFASATQVGRQACVEYLRAALSDTGVNESLKTVGKMLAFGQLESERRIYADVAMVIARLHLDGYSAEQQKVLGSHVFVHSIFYRQFNHSYRESIFQSHELFLPSIELALSPLPVTPPSTTETTLKIAAFGSHDAVYAKLVPWCKKLFDKAEPFLHDARTAVLFNEVDPLFEVWQLTQPQEKWGPYTKSLYQFVQRQLRGPFRSSFTHYEDYLPSEFAGTAKSVARKAVLRDMLESVFELTQWPARWLDYSHQKEPITFIDKVEPLSDTEKNGLKRAILTYDLVMFVWSIQYEVIRQHFDRRSFRTNAKRTEAYVNLEKSVDELLRYLSGVLRVGLSVRQAELLDVHVRHRGHFRGHAVSPTVLKRCLKALSDEERMKTYCEAVDAHQAIVGSQHANKPGFLDLWFLPEPLAGGERRLDLADDVVSHQLLSMRLVKIDHAGLQRELRGLDPPCKNVKRHKEKAGRKASGRDSAIADVPIEPLVIDHERVESLHEESVALRGDLAKIFAEDEPSAPVHGIEQEATRREMADDAIRPTVFNEKHHRILLSLAAGGRATEEQMRQWCRELGVMVGAAVEAINEVALAAFETVAIEVDDDGYELDPVFRKRFEELSQ